MQNIIIRRPSAADYEEVCTFFEMVITDTYTKEGIAHLENDRKVEIEGKKQYIKSDLDSNGIDRYFLIALEEDKIIGSIEYGAANEIIRKNTAGELEGIPEVGTVFVHPGYQGQGIGSSLLKEIFIALKILGIKECCLDSGYKNAQKIWRKKFGEPTYWIKDYWGEGSDHMIWIIRL